MDSIMGIISLALHTIRILNDMLGRMCDNASLRIQGFAWLEFDSSVPEEFYHPIIPVPLPAGSERKQKTLKFYLSDRDSSRLFRVRDFVFWREKNHIVLILSLER